MSNPKGMPSRILLVSELERLQGYVQGWDSEVIQTGRSLSDFRDVSISHLRLLILGHDVALGQANEVVPRLKEVNPGMFVIWVSESKVPDDIYAASRFSDTVLVLPEDASLLHDAVRNTLQRPGAKLSLKAFKSILQFLAGLALLIAIWDLIVRIFQLPVFLLPPPHLVALELVNSWQDYARHTMISAFEALLGFISGNVCGFIVGVLLHRWEVLRKLSLPFLIGLQSVPIVAFAPLLIVWMGAGLASKIAMAAIICFFPMVVNTTQAFTGVSQDARDLFTLYRASYLSTLRMLLLPAALPSLVAALQISAGLAVVGAIVAELTGADSGLGFVLLNSSYRLQTERMFVAIILASLLGSSFYFLPGLLLKGRRRDNSI